MDNNNDNNQTRNFWMTRTTLEKTLHSDLDPLPEFTASMTKTEKKAVAMKAVLIATAVPKATTKAIAMSMLKVTTKSIPTAMKVLNFTKKSILIPTKVLNARVRVLVLYCTKTEDDLILVYEDEDAEIVYEHPSCTYC